MIKTESDEGLDDKHSITLTADAELYDDCEETDLNQKKVKTPLRKAPQAPKRFKSSYILFFIHVQDKVKAELGGKSSAPAVSKKASELWKALSPKEREHWDNEARKEKERYMIEKAAYTGPWQVPHKRAKKDPTAPKRNPSAFLLYSQGKRRELKEINPGMKNTEISRMLGELWHNTSEEEKRPHIEREQRERKRYKIEMAEWKKRKQEGEIITKKNRIAASSSKGKGGKRQLKKELTDHLQKGLPQNDVHRGGWYDQSPYMQPHDNNQNGYGRNGQYPSTQMWYDQGNQVPPHPTPQETYSRSYSDMYAPGQYPQQYQSQPQAHQPRPGQPHPLKNEGQQYEQGEVNNSISEISPTPYPYPNYSEQHHPTSPIQYNYFLPSPTGTPRDNDPQTQQHNSYNRGGAPPPPPIPRTESFHMQNQQYQQQHPHQSSSTSNGFDQELFSLYPMDPADYDKYDPVPFHR